MNLLFRGMAWLGLGLASLGSLGLAFLYLAPYYSLFRNYGPGLGPQVHGMELMVGLLYCGIPASVGFTLGLIGAVALRFRQDPSFLRLYGKWTLGLLALTLVVLAIDYALPRIGRMIYDRQQVSAGQSKAIVDDPQKFAAYIGQAKDLNAPLPQDPWTPLRETVLHGYTDLAQKILEKGGVVTQGDLETAAQKGDPAMTGLLWDHSKGLDGGSVLMQAFLSGQSEPLRTLVGKGLPTDGCLRRLCAYLFARPITPGQRDWELLYPPALKGKGYADSMFRFMAQKASGKQGAEARKTLKIAVYARDPQVVKMMVEEGFDIHTLDGQLAKDPLLTQDPEITDVMTECGENLRDMEMAVDQAKTITKYKELSDRMAAYLALQKVVFK